MPTDFSAVAGSHHAQGGFARRDELLATGVTRSAIASAAIARGWDRPYRGVYRVGETTAHPKLWAAHVLLGPDSVAVLSSAAEVHGLQGTSTRRVPAFALPPGLEKQQRSGLHLHFWKMPADEVAVVDGLPVTSVIRTLSDVARLLPRLQAVALIDSALNLGKVTLGDLDVAAELMRRKRNCVAGRSRIGEARIGAQSPLETRVRIRASDGGFPPDDLQVPIRDDSGALLGYADLGYRLPNGSWLVVEADGRSVHELPEALLHDRRRQNAFLASAGVAILRFTWEDTQHPGYIPSVLQRILAPAGWRPPRRA